MKIENMRHFFLETPLYEKFNVDANDGEILFDLIFLLENLIVTALFVIERVHLSEPIKHHLLEVTELPLMKEC